MELPDHYFPVSPCPYSLNLKKGSFNRKHLNFAEYGAYQNLNLDSQGDAADITFWPQKRQQSTTGLSAALPTIPLNEKPFESQWIFTDRILGVPNYKDTVWNMKFIIQTLPLRRRNLHNIPTISSNLKQCINALNSVEKSKKTLDITSLLHEKLPSSVYELYESLDDIGHAFNSDVSTNSDTGLKSLSLRSSFPTSDVFQICTSNKFGRKVLVCARERESCQLFSLCDDSGTLQEKKSTDFNEIISCICFSPFVENEILVSSPKGNVYLWDIDSGVSSLRLDKKRKAQVLTPWSSSYFCGHPRHIAVADNKSVLLFDHRSRFQNGVVLFSLPAFFAKEDEQVMAACSAGFPYHCLATDNGLFLLDSRFPGSPVLNWSSEMLSPPQYLQLLESQEETRSGRKLLFLASQQPAEVMCFPVDLAVSRPPTAPVFPWRVSKINEFSSIFSAADVKLKKRFENSLAGFTTPERCDDGGFTVYQLDSCGDIFYQSFVPDRHTESPLHWENTSTTEMEGQFQSFKACTKTEKDAAHTRIEQWLAALEQQILDVTAKTVVESQNKEHEGFKLLDVDPKLMTDIFKCSPAHAEHVVDYEAERSGPIDVNPLRPHANLKLFTNLLYKRSQTQLLLALRDREDIDGFVKQRETSHLRLKMDKRREFTRQERANSPTKQRRKKYYEAMKKRESLKLSTSADRPHSSTDQPHSNTDQTLSNLIESIVRSYSYNQTSEQQNREENLNPSEETTQFKQPISIHFFEENLSSLEEPRADIFHRTMVGDEDQCPVQSTSHMSPLHTKIKTSQPLPSTSNPTRVSSPSLFSSSSSSSSSLSSSTSSSNSADDDINEQIEVRNKNNNLAESSHSGFQTQQETLPYSNVISWLLHSYSSNAKSSDSQENETTSSSLHKTLSNLAQASSAKENMGLSLADIEKRKDEIEEPLDDDAVSECSSQRPNTLARPDLRRVVDPHLSGFLSSPQKAKRLRRNLTE
ncbi:TATA box-binding protein (Tbp)-associated factor, RNA polymerase I, C [Elysia marginata]|uniref:TATA box-binding protein (Tbp)-associated factor, RNA polymerase I, C n=1 Tax=Elysia marginata TaxID=1093978 RepID=A0AAV4H9W6_9GAST|nr:TATA box-binding protein (Tbp)-associated factor, RNA polymerase I, C [Elysia marginata]